jgi:toxin ParE1/3/4
VKAKPIVPREFANRDVEGAIAYCLSESSDQVGLGSVDALERAYRHISRHPGSGSSCYAVELNLLGLRPWPLRRFSHIVFYVETKDCIDVWRVLHCARDVPAWMQETNSG